MEDLDSIQIGKADCDFKCKPPGLICMWCIADCFGKKTNLEMNMSLT